MGFAPALMDTYFKYKHGTDSFVQWLGDTARATGKVQDVFAAGLQERIPVAGGRLKGKAREEANAGLGASANTATYEIPIGAFVKLAKAVSSAGNIEVPRSVFATLRAVIRGRKECAAWYMINQDGADNTMKGNNERHQHFIGVLEDTLQALKNPRFEQQQPPSSTKDTMKKVTNMFECLELEDTDELEEIPDRTPFNFKVEKNVEYKSEISDANVFFAVFCFLKDLENIRLFVRRTWREFKDDKTELQAAALTMNAAIGIIEKLNDTFLQTFPDFKGTGMGMHLTITDYIYQGQDAFADTDGGQNLNYNTALCTDTTNLILRHFFKKGHRTLTLSADENTFIKGIFQLGSLPVAIAETGKPFHGDMIHKAAWNVVHDRQLTTWNVFALQIFWDAQRELGAMLPLAHLQLKKQSRDLRKSCNAYLDTGAIDEIRIQLQAHLDQIEILAIRNVLQECADNFEESVDPVLSVPGFSLLSTHPAFCGLILLHLRDVHHRMAIDIAGSQGHILVAAHLYNAAHSSGLLPNSLRWADMDYFIEKQGSDWIFVGGRPQDPTTISRRLNLAKGVSASIFAKDYKFPKFGNGKDGHYTTLGKIRQFGYLPQYSELGWSRVSTKDRKKSGVRSRAGLDLTVMADAMAKEELGITKPMTLSPLATLGAFKKAIEKDECGYNFDVMDLHLRCTRLLDGIRAHCLQNAPHDFPKSEYGPGMKDVVDALFIHNALHSNYDELMFPAAVKFLRKIIEQEGDTVLKSAKTREEPVRLQRGILKGEIKLSNRDSMENTL